MGRQSAGGAAAAGRGAATQVRPGEGTGNTRPINAYIQALDGASRSYARGYVSVLTRGASQQNQRQTGTNAGLTTRQMNEIERQIDSRSRRLTDRRRGPNR